MDYNISSTSLQRGLSQRAIRFIIYEGQINFTHQTVSTYAKAFCRISWRNKIMSPPTTAHHPHRPLTLVPTRVPSSLQLASAAQGAHAAAAETPPLPHLGQTRTYRHPRHSDSNKISHCVLRCLSPSGFPLSRPSVAFSRRINRQKPVGGPRTVRGLAWDIKQTSLSSSHSTHTYTRTLTSVWFDPRRPGLFRSVQTRL